MEIQKGVIRIEKRDQENYLCTYFFKDIRVDECGKPVCVYTDSPLDAMQLSTEFWPTTRYLLKFVQYCAEKGARVEFVTFKVICEGRGRQD